MSSNDIIKQIQIPGKGQNETLENVIPLQYTRAANDDSRDHVPENSGARAK
jgi:hypothetical protein